MLSLNKRAFDYKVRTCSLCYYSFPTHTHTHTLRGLRPLISSSFNFQISLRNGLHHWNLLLRHLIQAITGISNLSIYLFYALTLLLLFDPLNPYMGSFSFMCV